jgi:hypothetical protein
MTVRLIGANPGLTLYPPADGDPADDPADRDPADASAADPEPVAYASVWRVDWSRHGAGTALVLWHGGTTRVLTATPPLGDWLAAEFNRHFPEVKGLAWPEPQLTVTPVTLEIDLAHGMRAAAADVEVEISDPIDRRLIRVDEFDLGGTPHLLSNVLIPCRSGALRIAGTRVAGVPRVTSTPRASSTAFLADAEVWCHTQPVAS